MWVFYLILGILTNELARSAWAAWHRKPKGPRMLFYVIEVAHPLSNGETYWGRDTEHNVFKALNGGEACDTFRRKIAREEDRVDRRIRRIDESEFLEHGGII